MAKTGFEQRGSTESSPAVPAAATHVQRAKFWYQGTSAFGKAAIRLLVALKASGVRLTEISYDDASGVFVERGTVHFAVSGTASEIEMFRRMWQS